ncbi:hypothetical protein [Roseiflexus sp.]|uniref:hypothetical protein n=1 Tax=Roseiflexus sp. TaxID=2562120 RepID=UPI0025DB25F6|nr:hypothetical protein [Roseiflexus sp.]
MNVKLGHGMPCPYRHRRSWHAVPVPSPPVVACRARTVTACWGTACRARTPVAAGHAVPVPSPPVGARHAVPVPAMPEDAEHSPPGRKALSDAGQIDAVVDAILAAPKYRSIAPTLVRTLAVRELAVRRNLREAIKATKNRLHQVVGAYVEQRIDVERWLTLLQRGTALPPVTPSDETLLQAAQANPRVAHLDLPSCALRCT